MFDFINISIIDVIDFLLVGFLIYQVFKLIRGTSAFNIFTAIILLYLIWLLVKSLKMTLLSAILGQVMGVGVLALIILFQQEIRRFLFRFGTRYMNSRKKLRFIDFLFGKKEGNITNENLNEITQACRRMAESKTGALIVMLKSSSLESIIESGDRLDARISRRLIENIFFKNAPMHDGAMVIDSEKIVAVRCTLPISDNPQIPASLGMRHRAAIGVTELTDAVAIVVSEQTGGISFVSDGVLKKINSITELRISIENSFRAI